jgi:hypothetical protein
VDTFWMRERNWLLGVGVEEGWWVRLVPIFIMSYLLIDYHV